MNISNYLTKDNSSCAFKVDKNTYKPLTDPLRSFEEIRAENLRQKANKARMNNTTFATGSINNQQLQGNESGTGIMNAVNANPITTFTNNFVNAEGNWSSSTNNSNLVMNTGLLYKISYTDHNLHLQNDSQITPNVQSNKFIHVPHQRSELYPIKENPEQEQFEDKINKNEIPIIPNNDIYFRNELNELDKELDIIKLKHLNDQVNNESNIYQRKRSYYTTLSKSKDILAKLNDKSDFIFSSISELNPKLSKKRRFEENANLFTFSKQSSKQNISNAKANKEFNFHSSFFKSNISQSQTQQNQKTEISKVVKDSDFTLDKYKEHYKIPFIIFSLLNSEPELLYSLDRMSLDSSKSKYDLNKASDTKANEYLVSKLESYLLLNDELIDIYQYIHQVKIKNLLLVPFSLNYNNKVKFIIKCLNYKEEQMISEFSSLLIGIKTYSSSSLSDLNKEIKQSFALLRLPKEAYETFMFISNYAPINLSSDTPIESLSLSYKYEEGKLKVPINNVLIFYEDLNLNDLSPIVGNKENSNFLSDAIFNHKETVEYKPYLIYPTLVEFLTKKQVSEDALIEKHRLSYDVREDMLYSVENKLVKISFVEPVDLNSIFNKTEINELSYESLFVLTYLNARLMKRSELSQLSRRVLSQPTQAEHKEESDKYVCGLLLNRKITITLDYSLVISDVGLSKEEIKSFLTEDDPYREIEDMNNRFFKFGLESLK